MSGKSLVTATINGEGKEFLCEPRQSLLEVLRDVLYLTGTKEGCNDGNCGACSVIVDGVLLDSCCMLAVEAEGSSIETIEGLAAGTELHPLQRAFLEETGCNAVSARRAFSWPQRPCWIKLPNRTSNRCATGWRATCAAAPAMTSWCGPY